MHRQEEEEEEGHVSSQSSSRETESVEEVMEISTHQMRDSRQHTSMTSPPGASARTPVTADVSVATATDEERIFRQEGTEAMVCAVTLPSALPPKAALEPTMVHSARLQLEPPPAPPVATVIATTPSSSSSLHTYFKRSGGGHSSRSEASGSPTPVTSTSDSTRGLRAPPVTAVLILPVPESATAAAATLVKGAGVLPESNVRWNSGAGTPKLTSSSQRASFIKGQQQAPQQRGTDLLAELQTYPAASSVASRDSLISSGSRGGGRDSAFSTAESDVDVPGAAQPVFRQAADTDATAAQIMRPIARSLDRQPPALASPARGDAVISSPPSGGVQTAFLSPVPQIGGFHRPPSSNSTGSGGAGAGTRLSPVEESEASVSSRSDVTREQQQLAVHGGRWPAPQQQQQQEYSATMPPQRLTETQEEFLREQIMRQQQKQQVSGALVNHEFTDA